MLSSCFGSSTWNSAAIPRLSFQPSHSLPISLSLSLSFHFSLSLSLTLGTAPLPDHLGLSSMKPACACVSVGACACVHMWAGMCEREFQPLLKRAYTSMFVCPGLCVCLLLCVIRRVFLRQVDSCYLVALQLSQQSQGV